VLIARYQRQVLRGYAGFNILLILSNCGGSPSKNSGKGLAVNTFDQIDQNDISERVEEDNSQIIEYSGTVIKGPLKNAVVFLDYNENSILDLGEPSAKSDDNGNFELFGKSGVEYITAITDAETIDILNGNNLEGLYFEASTGSNVITPFTTLLVNSKFSKEQLSDAVGLPKYIDFESFNPFQAGADTGDALKYEIIAQQISHTTAMLTSLFVQGQLTDQKSYKLISSVLATNLSEQITEGNDVSFLENTFLASVVESVMQLDASVNEVELLDNGFDTSNIVDAVQSINSGIASLSDLNSVQSILVQNEIFNIRSNLEAALIEKNTKKFSEQLTALETLNDGDIWDISAELVNIDNLSDDAEENSGKLVTSDINSDELSGEGNAANDFDENSDDNSDAGSVDDLIIPIDQQTYPVQHHYTHPDEIIDIKIIETENFLNLDIFILSDWNNTRHDEITNASVDLKFDENKLIFSSGDYESDFSDLFPIEANSEGIISIGSIWFGGLEFEDSLKLVNLEFEKIPSNDFEFILSNIELGNSAENIFHEAQWSFVV